VILYRDIIASAFGRFTLSIGNTRLTYRVSGGNAQSDEKFGGFRKFLYGLYGYELTGKDCFFQFELRNIMQKEKDLLEV
jgi:hypothetical protein